MTPLDLQWMREKQHQWEQERRTRNGSGRGTDAGRHLQAVPEDETEGGFFAICEDYDDYRFEPDEDDDPESTSSSMAEALDEADPETEHAQAMLRVETAKTQAEIDEAIDAAMRLQTAGAVVTPQWPEPPSGRVQAAWAVIALIGTFGTAAALTFGVTAVWAVIAPYAATLLGLIAVLEFAFISSRIGSPTVWAVDALLGTRLDARLRRLVNPEASEAKSEIPSVETAPHRTALAAAHATSHDFRAIVSEHAPESLQAFDEAEAVLALAGRARGATTDPILRDRIESVLSKVDGLAVSLAGALDLADRTERTELAAEAVQSLTILAAAADHERALVQRSARDAFEQQRRYIESAHPDAGDLRPIE